MINNIYVEMLATKIFLKEINPKTGQDFKIEDVKKEEYKQPILLKVAELEKTKRESEKNETNIN